MAEHKQTISRMNSSNAELSCINTYKIVIAGIKLCRATMNQHVLYPSIHHNSKPLLIIRKYIQHHEHQEMAMKSHKACSPLHNYTIVWHSNIWVCIKSKVMDSQYTFWYGLYANPVSWPFKRKWLASPVAITRTSTLLSYYSVKSL